MDSPAKAPNATVPRIGYGRARQLNEQECVQILRAIRWPGAVACAHCSSARVIRTGRHQTFYQRYRCKSCGRIFNDKTGTIFENSRLPLRVWFLAASLQRGRSIRSVSNSLGMHYDTTHRIVSRLRRSGFPDLISGGQTKASATRDTPTAREEDAGVEARERPIATLREGRFS